MIASTALASNSYRRDIDGLRALAVVPVVLFHAGMPGVDGGFVGVDIFFVISGFLITRIIHQEMTEQRFSYAEFYERRIRRIFPAFLVTILITSVLASRYLMPAEMRSFAQSVIGALLFGANFTFWLQSDYFDAASNTKPLLHLWSLAVEEQFYIAFPTILGFALKFGGRRAAATAVWVLAILSFLYSIYAVTYRPMDAFYLLPGRVWELAAGALLALQAVPRFRGRTVQQIMSVVGLGLIAYGIFFLSDRLPFPGQNALFPVLGAALLIQYGEGTAVGKLLSTAPFVGVGRISYSLYLWHWPLLVLGQYSSLVTLDLFSRLALVGVAVALAVTSYYLVEMPFRRRQVAGRRVTIFVSAAAFSVAVGALAGLAIQQSGFPQRLPAEALRLAGFSADYSRNRPTCHAGTQEVFLFADRCKLGKSDVPPRFAVWGDSHAVELTQILGEIAGEQGQAVLQLSNSGCPPAVGYRQFSRQMCSLQVDNDLEGIEASSTIQTVFIVARYSSYDVSLLFRGLEASIKTLKDGGKRVVLIYPTPDFDQPVPALLARAAIAGLSPAAVSVPTNGYLSKNHEYLAGLKDLVDRYGLEFVDPTVKMCGNDFCLSYSEGRALYFDDDHLSLSGAKFISSLFSSFLVETR